MKAWRLAAPRDCQLATMSAYHADDDQADDDRADDDQADDDQAEDDQNVHSCVGAQW